MKNPVTSAPTLVISETVSGTWNYHLRRVGPEGIKLGGGAPPALCGQKLGWDTKIPLKAWGTKDHIPSVWCSKCEELNAYHS